MSSSFLPGELFDESNWPAARVEARRVVQSDPKDELATAVEAAATLRQAPTNESACAVLRDLQAGATSASVRTFCLAETGFNQWARQDLASALSTLTRAFQQSEDPVLRARASFGVCILLSRIKVPREIDRFWDDHLVNCIPTWTAEIRASGAIRPAPGNRRSIWSLPGELIVSFYRGLVRPALGSRCVLEPSCSEYFLQASRKTGWLGFPMIGDRFIREPDVVNDKANPVLVNGAMRYADPVEDHVYFEKKGRR